MKMDRDHVRTLRMGEDPADSEPASLTPAEGIGIMWQLALDAWAFRGEPLAEPRLPRHVVRLIRGGR